MREVLGVVGATAVLAMAVGAHGQEPAAEAASTIRHLRLEYNQVIQSRDPAGFGRFLSPSFTEMVSTGEVTMGAKAVADSYAAREFKDPTFIAYDRRPDTIVVDGRRAVERGHWRARFHGPKGTEVRGEGLYQAGWVRSDTGWLIQTEAYVELGRRRGTGQ